MASTAHFTALRNMYLAGPINDFFRPRIEVREGEATIELDVSEKLHHSAGGLHGSVYFKMLDDAAFFAANSLETHFFLVTSSFTTYFLRPVATGTLRSVGRVVHRSRSQYLAEAVVSDADGNDVARGHGVFVRGRLALAQARGYAS